MFDNGSLKEEEEEYDSVHADIFGWDSKSECVAGGRCVWWVGYWVRCVMCVVGGSLGVVCVGMFNNGSLKEEYDSVHADFFGWDSKSEWLVWWVGCWVWVWV